MNPKELVCKENHRVFRLYTNGSAFSKIKLDDGQDNKRKKCDYLITKDTKDIQIFVELKGNQIANAFRQILTSYENKECIENLQVKYYAAIVCSRFPQIDSTIQNLQKDAKKIFKKVFIKGKELKTQYDINNYEITDKLADMNKCWFFRLFFTQTNSKTLHKTHRDFTITIYMRFYENHDIIF